MLEWASRGSKHLLTEGQLWGHNRLCRVWSPPRMDGACPASSTAWPSSRELYQELRKVLYWTGTVLLGQQPSVSLVNISPMRLKTARGVLGYFQNRGDANEHNQKLVIWMGGRKSTTNPWMKSADKFKLKRNGSNPLKFSLLLKKLLGLISGREIH